MKIEVQLNKRGIRYPSPSFTQPQQIDHSKEKTLEQSQDKKLAPSMLQSQARIHVQRDATNKSNSNNPYVIPKEEKCYGCRKARSSNQCLQKNPLT